jgi:hypothetical protein
MKKLLITLVLLATNTLQAQLLLEKGNRILWLGDSVTANGTHIGLIDAYLLTQHPDLNITNPLTAAIARKRQADPKFKSGDGVHPNSETYATLAEIILDGLGEKNTDLKKIPAEKQKLALQKHKMLATSYREHVGHKRPGAPKNPMLLAEALEKTAAIEKQIRATVSAPATQAE